MRTIFVQVLIVMLTACSYSGKGKIILVKNRKTDYCIFLDSNAPGSIKTAAKDLKNYFIKVTGASPEIISGSQIPSIPFISLGNTIASREAGLDISGVPIDGYRIVTEEKNIYIYGPDTPDDEVNKKGGINCGTSNGVYAFIEDYLGVRWLMPGEIGEEYPEVRTLVIPPVDRTEYSPFEYRVISRRDKGPLEDEWDRRLKLGEVARIEHNHNWNQTIPPELFDTHPEWFAMKDGKRIPPVGYLYKLETTNQEMVQYYADKIMQSFRKDSMRRWHSLSPSDGGGWSESPESAALTEMTADGKLSLTPLVLTFYNDVARIVGKEFPDHKLGGYIYSSYSCPPSSTFQIESNISLIIANEPTYGFRLYRPHLQERWGEAGWIPQWSELSKKYGFDIYYYDLPNTIMTPNGIIFPPAPELLNITFSGMVKYGFKGGFIYGNPIWPVFAPGNYTIARLFWNPEQDAHEILQEFYQAAYGAKSGIYIEKIFHLLDTVFAGFYNRNPSAGHILTESHLQEIYAPYYPAMEQYYLKANSIKKNSRQQKRLELLGQVLSILQWNLRDYGYLSPDYKSPLTMTTDEVDKLLDSQNDDCRITRQMNFRWIYLPEKIRQEYDKPGKAIVEPVPPLPDSGKEKEMPLPLNRTFYILMHVPADGEVSITVEKFNKRAEFIQYLLTDEDGEKLSIGAVFEGREIKFNGETGKNYFLHIGNKDATACLKVKGALVAYSIPSIGLTLDGDYMDEYMLLYFYVPKGINSFGLTSKGIVADVYSPESRKISVLNSPGRSVSHVLISGNDVKEGFYKLVIHKFSKRNTVLELDKKLPQWIITDPAHPLKITN